MCIWEVQTILYSDRISLIVLLQTWSVYIHSGVQEGGTLMIFIWSNTGDRTWPTETYVWGLFEIQSSLFPIPFFSTQLISLDYRFWWLRSNPVSVFTSINKSILRWCSTAMEEVVYWVWRNCSLLVVMQRFLLCCILQHLGTLLLSFWTSFWLPNRRNLKEVSGFYTAYFHRETAS